MEKTDCLIVVYDGGHYKISLLDHFKVHKICNCNNMQYVMDNRFVYVLRGPTPMLPHCGSS